MKQKISKNIIWISAMLLSVWSYTNDHQAGNGSDQDPKTWHFNPSNKNSFLATDSNVAIKNSEILNYFDITTGFTILIDKLLATDYNWTFLADANGISNLNWLSTTYPTLENMRVDSTRARIKSNPGFNFKWAAQNGYDLGSVTDSSHPSFIELNTYRDATKEVLSGIILYFDGTKYVYRTIQMNYTPTTSEKENTDDYSGVTGWTISSALPLDSTHTLCKELVSDVDSFSTTTKVVFGAYCPGASVNTGSAYAFEFDGTTFTKLLLSSTVPEKNATGNDILQHISVAHDGEAPNSYFAYTNSDSDSSVQSNIRVKEGITTGGSAPEGITYSYGADVAINNNARCFDTPSKYKFRDAFSPSIDCAGNSCYITYTNELATVSDCTNGSGSYKEEIMAFQFVVNSATPLATTTFNGQLGDKSNVIPVDGDAGPFKGIKKIIAFSDATTDTAGIVYKFVVAETGISQLKMIYYSGTKWPRKSIFSSGGATAGRYSISQVSNSSEDVPIAQIEAKVGQGNNLYIFWTQGDRAAFPTDPNDPAIGTAERQIAPAKYIYFRKWQFNNLNTSTNELTFDSIVKSQVTSDNLTNFDWSYFKSGRAYGSFVQNNNLYFQHFNSQNFDSGYSIVSKGGSFFAKSMTYTKYPLIGSKGPASGRTVTLWQEDQKLYARAYYDRININVKYTFQNWGTVLTPTGDKPTMVRNNYIRPGEKRDVEIFVNDRSASEKVNIWIYDVNGEIVQKIITDQQYNSFSQPVFWDKKNGSGSYVAAGLYHVLIKTSGGFMKTHPIIIVR